MEIYNQEKRQHYLEQYSISHLFSFQVEEFMEVREYKRDEWIIREGMRPDYLYYVIEGKAKIYVTYQNGKVSLINFINAHDYIGEMELLHEVYYTKGIQASTKTICFAMPLHKYRNRLLEDTTFLRELTKFLSMKATKMAEKYSQSLSFPLENRLADFILQTADGEVYKEKHVTVCDFLGVSYRHLLHVLVQFCDKGYLQKEGRQYLIRRSDELHRLADVLKNDLH
ncbi:MULTISPECIES: transcriptional regulator YeiL [Cytobacillus]|jgi:CRP/FNR family transcriptional regulator, putaive post-exponential-phase nitrogen-starvation regulator|uniref:Transcriptional regulator YeiL n=1 Tax=Cytobacillus oceanisediminis TaxID=665099 RepID=A0ABX3CPQ2_9BACI|nr:MULTISPECIES: transcriptional regulator YeiL [Cytobacillus]MBY0157737.1 transcriptional regulator YeiL [Cytobacillus firmus]MCM3243780.1 transcriptional regulator YeiL [Cytobacillus oceanisediminis]MCM3391847.1 transcriptional regulator YeiL [Cytobacillus oceanisediminis]MCM3402389.1 transcriptional regulator YeiL [Cytobacillus oceanisediminis]MCM3528742.1 transcriptional regulator YeiL [Cytobacillus oceanisediminis]